MAERSFQISSGPACDTQELPRDFVCLRVLGEGGFGRVLKCLRNDGENRKQTVAVKIPKFLMQDSNEVPMLEKLMLEKLDQKNIIQFLGWYPTCYGKALVFESLDISLEQFILKRSCKPMLLGDVRDIIEQLATAFEALKSIGVIHTDLKIDNVMMVNHRRRPYGVKLIDFGLAIHRSNAKQGTITQVIPYRAPEISLGLPFSEAIDVWSLGSVMAAMLHGGELFPGNTEYEMLQEIISLLGFPADHLLDAGLRTRKFFVMTKSGNWRLKTNEECGIKDRYQPLTNTLDGLRKIRVETGNENEAVLRPLGIDLMEAMVQLDQDKRITPSEILSHPFITWREQGTNMKRRFNVPPPGVIQVRPAAAEKSQLQDEPGKFLIQHASAEICMLLDFDEEISEVSQEPPAAVDHRSPSPEKTPPGVIQVSPASAENRLVLDVNEEATEVTQETPAAVDQKEVPRSPSPWKTPPGVIQVSPASAENRLVLDEEASEVTQDTPAALDQNQNMDTDHSDPSARDTPPGVIQVRPATAENTLQQEEDEDTAPKLKTGLKTFSVERTDRDSTDRDSTDRDSTPETEGCTSNQKKEQKKRKNRVRRLFSWFKKNFGSCCSSTDNDQDD